LTSNAKTDLRRHLRAQRAMLTPAQQAHAGRALDVQVSETRLFHVCRRIACYLPANGEIDPARVMERIWGLNKVCYLPVLSRIQHDRLWFAPVKPDARLRPNRYGILEPVTLARNLVRAQELDLILLPLVGFDAHCHRLGMGKGFYDRSLEFLNHRQHWRKPHTLGLAHDFQRVDRLPADPWDVPLQGVVTDKAFYGANG
jgi:5-formyltetrahydrofolate cyclo-ligase